MQYIHIQYYNTSIYSIMQYIIHNIMTLYTYMLYIVYNIL